MTKKFNWRNVVKMTVTCLAVFVTFSACEKDNEGKGSKEITWATSNVAAPGQFAASPENAGMLYQWGSNVGWSKTNPLTASDGNNTWRDLHETGKTWTTDKNPCPTGWRLPTKAEMQSLVNAGHTYTNNYNGTGIAGRVFGTGDNAIFLPAGQARGANSQLDVWNYEYAYYWTSTPHESDNAKAWELYFNFDNSYVFTEAQVRTAAFFIRCVK